MCPVGSLIWRPRSREPAVRDGGMSPPSSLEKQMSTQTGPWRARATRTAVGIISRTTPLTRASGRPSAAPSPPRPSPRAVTAGPAQTPPQEGGARTAGMCGARALRPTTGTATATAGRAGRARVGRAGPRPPRRRLRPRLWTRAGTTRTGSAGCPARPCRVAAVFALCPHPFPLLFDPSKSSDCSTRMASQAGLEGCHLQPRSSAWQRPATRDADRRPGVPPASGLRSWDGMPSKAGVCCCRRWPGRGLSAMPDMYFC